MKNLALTSPCRLSASPRLLAWSRSAAFLLAIAVVLSAAPPCPAEPPAAATASADSPVTAAALASFVREYSLAEGQALKRVNQPFSPARQAYYQIRHARQAESIARGPDYLTFAWGDPERSDPQIAPLRQRSMGWADGRGLRLRDVLAQATGLPLAQLLGDPADLERRLPGDWVFRHGAAPEAIAAEFQAALRDEFDPSLRIAHELREVPVIIAEGDYEYAPLPKYGTWYDDQLVHYIDTILAVDQPLETLPAKQRKLQGYNQLESLLEFLSNYTQLPVIDRIGKRRRGNDTMLQFLYSARRYREAMANRDGNAEYLLGSISQQTGIRFTKEMQTMSVVVVERAGDNAQ